MFDAAPCCAHIRQVHTLRIGCFDVSVLDDGTWRFPAHHFFANVPEAIWRAEVEVDDQGKIPVGHNHGLVRSPHSLVVIDTGYGDDTHGGCTGHLLAEFESSGHQRDDVTHVITTHAHGDHVKRHTVVREGRREPIFPRARYLVHRADWQWFSGAGHVPEFDEQIAPLARWGLLVLIDGACEPVPGIQLLPTPGHTPGHCSLLVESEGACVLFVGDVCHHPLHFKHLDWVSSFDTDPAIAPRTRAWLFELALARDALVVCPHAPSPGLGHVRRRAGGYAWEPCMPAA